MSRNIDRANSLLVKYQESQAEKASGYKDYNRYKRPTRISSVKSLEEAKNWRAQVINEFKTKNTRIYDPSLNETQIRELNDQLNDLVFEKKRWDRHIEKQLTKSGKHGGKWTNERDRLFVTGKLVLGKRYFGRAVELPEIKSYLDEQARRKASIGGQDIVDLKRIPQHGDPRGKLYYHSTEDEQLARFEAEWTPRLREAYLGSEAAASGNTNTITDTSEEDRSHTTKSDSEKVPTLRDVELWLVERRKRKLLESITF